MNLQYRIDLLSRLGEYMMSDTEEWQAAKTRAFHENSWFIPEFTDLAVKQIAETYLQRSVLEKWVSRYPSLLEEQTPLSIGIITAGNIPLVGFHDWLTVFISGNSAIIKTSSKDQAMIRHLTGKMDQWINDEKNPSAVYADMLKGCDAYIATGSYNSSRYFKHYFGKYPHIIRRNKTSVAVLDGKESTGELEKLADDVYLYFGLGCRNVTKIFVPEDYDFIPMLEAFKKYSYLEEHNKYKNNYDYNLALLILNKRYYMTNGSILLVEDPSLFSPISQLHFSYYDDTQRLNNSLNKETDLQCIVGHQALPFGQAQNPAVDDYADGVDTLNFISGIGEVRKKR